ncbi:MAG: ribosome hibernation-promoting factor, HPF/YfiA family [Bacteroidales bacterium]
MKLTIQAVHFDMAKHLEEFIQKKVAKLEQHYDEIISIEVTLKVVKPESAMNKEVGILIRVPQNEIYSEKVADTFEEACDVNIEAVLKQLTKLKEKSRDK